MIITKHLLSKNSFPLKLAIIMPLILLLWFSFTLETKKNTMDTPELIYVYDPLCGWCYGFSPVMKKIKERYGDSLTYSVYTGGLVLGDRVGTVKDKFEYVLDAYKQVEETSGTLFGEGFKTNILGKADEYVFNSVPPGKAFVILKEMQPKNALNFAHDLQHAIYWDGKDIHQPEMYVEIAEKYGIDTSVFAQRFNDAAYDSLLTKDFETSAYYQAQGYPHVLLKKGDQYYLLTKGYTNYENLEAVINKVLNE